MILFLSTYNSIDNWIQQLEILTWFFEAFLLNSYNLKTEEFEERKLPIGG